MSGQVLKQKYEPISYSDLKLDDLVRLPKIEEDVSARAMYIPSENQEGSFVIRGIQINPNHRYALDKEIYSTYVDMLEEVYDKRTELETKDFEDLIELTAHEGFHQLEMYNNLNKKAEGLGDFESQIKEEEEGYAFLFGKLIKYVAILAEEQKHESLFNIYDEAIKHAEVEIEDTLKYMEANNLEKGITYQEYVLPAYKILQTEKVENLIPYVQEFMESAKYLLPSKYQSQDLKIFEHDLDFSYSCGF